MQFLFSSEGAAIWQTEGGKTIRFATVQLTPTAWSEAVKKTKKADTFNKTLHHQPLRIICVGVCSSPRTQKVTGSNPTVTNPERSALGSQLR